MKCKACEYPLWNLAARVCPECGRPFAPSEFEFVANSVRFCCPGCSQDYYGTGMQGHLEPSEFDCVRCGRHIRMDEMILLPTEGVREEQTEADVMPWLRWQQIGAVKAWASTLWRSLVDPVRLARTMPGEGGTLWAMCFAGLSVALFSVLTVAAIVAFALFAMPGGGGANAFEAIGWFLGMIAVVAFGVLPSWGLAAHGILRMGGATGQTMGASVRAASYCGGSGLVFMAVPCVGMYIWWMGVIWGAVSLMIMLRTLHGTGWVRPIFAAFVPPVLLFGAIVGLMAWRVSVSMSAIAAAQATAAATPQMSTQRICDALIRYRAAGDGSLPPHALRLVADGHLAWYDLAPGDSTGSMLDTWQVLSLDEQKAAAAAAERAMPAGAIAHRLGRMVFTYHGVTDGMDGDLWLVVVQLPGSSLMDVITLDGRVQLLPNTAEMLAAQNALRAAEGLAPLPDPATVTESAPAIGE